MKQWEIEMQLIFLKTEVMLPENKLNHCLDLFLADNSSAVST